MYRTFLRLVLLNIFASLILQFGTAQECNPPPTIGPTEPIVVEYFYITNEGGDLDTWLCEIMALFGNQISIQYKMGALSQIIDDALDCGPTGCGADIEIACKSMLDPSFHDCSPIPELDETALETCYTELASRDIVLANGQARLDYNIPDEALPLMVFNQTYDPCAVFTSSDDILLYVCEIYDSTATPCQS